VAELPQTAGELKPAEYNPRAIDDKALVGLAYSMDEFGDLSGQEQRRASHAVRSDSPRPYLRCPYLQSVCRQEARHSHKKGISSPSTLVLQVGSCSRAERQGRRVQERGRPGRIELYHGEVVIGVDRLGVVDNAVLRVRGLRSFRKP